MCEGVRGGGYTCDCVRVCVCVNVCKAYSPI